MAKKKKGLLKYLLILVGALLIVAVVGKKKGWFGKPDMVKVVVEQPQYRTIIESISANGKIQPVVEVKISPEVSGEIIDLPVREGEHVKKGQLLCRIKPDTYISIKERTVAAVNSSKARLAQVQAQLSQNQLNYNRSKQLYDQKAISESEYESAKTSLDMAKADVQAALFNVESSEASLREAIENLNKTNIFAPIDGTISKLGVELGERVVGTAQMPGTDILSIADLSRMETRVNVNENDIVRVKMNDTTLIDVDAYPTHKFKGIVTQIANSASITGGTSDQVTTFEVRIFILEDSYRALLTQGVTTPFRPGMSTNVEIQTKTKVNTLTVPILAVTTRSDSISLGATSLAEVTTEPEKEINTRDLKEIVFIARGDTAFMVAVRTGIQDNQHIEVLEGLSGDEEVIVAPFSAISRRLSQGTLIERTEADKLFQN